MASIAQLQEEPAWATQINPLITAFQDAETATDWTTGANALQLVLLRRIGETVICNAQPQLTDQTDRDRLTADVLTYAQLLGKEVRKPQAVVDAVERAVRDRPQDVSVQFVVHTTLREAVDNCPAYVPTVRGAESLQVPQYAVPEKKGRVDVDAIVDAYRHWQQRDPHFAAVHQSLRGPGKRVAGLTVHAPVARRGKATSARQNSGKAAAKPVGLFGELTSLVQEMRQEQRTTTQKRLKRRVLFGNLVKLIGSLAAYNRALRKRRDSLPAAVDTEFTEDMRETLRHCCSLHGLSYLTDVEVDQCLHSIHSKTVKIEDAKLFAAAVVSQVSESLMRVSAGRLPAAAARGVPHLLTNQYGSVRREALNENASLSSRAEHDMDRKAAYICELDVRAMNIRRDFEAGQGKQSDHEVLQNVEMMQLVECLKLRRMVLDRPSAPKNSASLLVALPFHLEAFIKTLLCAVAEAIAPDMTNAEANRCLRILDRNRHDAEGLREYGIVAQCHVVQAFLKVKGARA